MAAMLLRVLDYCTIFICLCMLDLRRVQCLFVSDIDVPEIVDYRDNVTLSCSYVMSGHTLNSVKWYKNNHEFFRYSPLMHPVYMKFPVVGVQLKDDSNFCNESTCRVELCALSKNSTGVYRCEVSGDAPLFKLTARMANMTVAALPQRDPIIYGYHSNYRFDEFVQINCSADFTSLPTQLQWYVNGAKASYVDLQPSIETTRPLNDYVVSQQTLQLSFYANEQRFHQSSAAAAAAAAVAATTNGQSVGRMLEVRCVADIPNYPELRRESVLRAFLLHDDDLNNQKLVNSGTTTNGSALLQLQCILLLLIVNFNIAKLDNQNIFTFANLIRR